MKKIKAIKMKFRVKNLMYIGLILFCVLLLSQFLISCSKIDKKNSHTKEIKVKVLNRKMLLSNYFDDVIYKIFNAPDSITIGDISAYYKFNEVQIIVDNRHTKAIYFFDSNNNFLRKIRKIGQGPGEYLKIVSSSIDEKGKRFFIFDRQKINIYSLPKFQYIKSINVSEQGGFADMIYFNDYIYLYSVSKYSNTLGLLGRINIENNKHDILLKNVPNILDLTSWIGKKQFSKSSSALYFIPSFSNIIYKFDQHGNMSKILFLKNKDIIHDYSNFISMGAKKKEILKKIMNYYSIIYTFSIANDSLLCLTMPYKRKLYFSYFGLHSPSMNFYSSRINDIDKNSISNFVLGSFVFTNINRYVESIQPNSLKKILKKTNDDQVLKNKIVKKTKINTIKLLIQNLGMKKNVPILMIYK